MPVHTLAEYKFFNQHINDGTFAKNTRKTYPAHEAYKSIDYEIFTRFWNAAVEKQNWAETDSNKRIYYKIPSQLERHHKKRLGWASECSTTLARETTTALKPFHDLLALTDGTETMPALLPPDINLQGRKDDSYSREG